MTKRTPPRQKAIGTIGPGKLADWEAAGLAVVYQADWLAVNRALSEQVARIAELERHVRLLSAAALDGGVGVPLAELREAVGG